MSISKRQFYVEELNPSNELLTYNVSGQQLAEIPERLSSRIQKLICSKNWLRYLPDLPRSLVVLKCSENYLREIPYLPATLKVLDFHQNGVEHMPAMHEGLTFLDCAQNQIRVIPSLPTTLKTFSCSDNFLRILPELPPQLLYFYCNYNRLVQLPSLPKDILYLSCKNNYIQELPSLPTKLTTLICELNPIQSLPPLPAGLKHLNCSYSFLNALPHQLPSGLLTLNCSGPSLKTLPVLPTTLQYFECKDHMLIGQYKAKVDQYTIAKHEILGNRQSTDGVSLRRKRLYQQLLARFIQEINTLHLLQQNIIAERFKPERILKNLERNKVDMNAPLTENNWSKYYNRRGEVWTEGVGEAFGPWQGGKTRKRKSKRRLNKTSKKH